MRTSLAAEAAIAFPCGPKMPALTFKRSLRSMPCLRGTAPTRRHHDAPSKAFSAFEVRMMSCSSGKAQSSSSIATPSSAFMAGSISSRRRMIGCWSPSKSPAAIRKRSE